MKGSEEIGVAVEGEAPPGKGPAWGTAEMAGTWTVRSKQRKIRSGVDGLKIFDLYHDSDGEPFKSLKEISDIIWCVFSKIICLQNNLERGKHVRKI